VEKSKEELELGMRKNEKMIKLLKRSNNKK
jgi:hypothetical protein